MRLHLDQKINFNTSNQVEQGLQAFPLICDQVSFGNQVFVGFQGGGLHQQAVVELKMINQNAQKD